MPSLDAAAAEAGAGREASEDGGRGPSSLLPGSLRHPDDPQAERWLEFLLSRKGRDAPMFLRKWLREAARKENVPQARSFKPGSISAAELRALADSLRRQSPAAAHRHTALLQLAEAAAAALEGPHAERWEALQREQRQLLFDCTESADAAASQLVDLCALVARSSSSGNEGSGGGSNSSRHAADRAVPLLGLDDLVLLVLAAYCLLPDFLPWFATGSGTGGGPFSPQQEQQLEAALVSAVMAGGGLAGSSGSASSSTAWPLAHLAARAAAARASSAADEPGSGSGHSSGGSDGSQAEAEAAAAAELRSLQLEARDAVQSLLGRMRELAAFRRSLLTAQQGQQLGRLAVVGEDGSPRPTPLLRQLVECILRDEPLPDLHAGATSLSGLLRSGLGRLGVKAGPKPSDRSTVIVFVLGGVSLAELHEIQQAVDERAARASSQIDGGGSSSGPQGASQAPPRIIVGGTALLQPRDLCPQLFAEL
ncbi:sec1 family domain-containing MIP3 [Chlorella sorokiniana]|uniref:Sec1 family domain-containing MIP3 n=1 Tax=Chlorella sorokiniana TaxID=3076 RepID=A0A2P6TMN8_CHLSO|nr:sec1 family domain-containing MIP3 [Chlorella sorokiniana]|eukprot:PRW45607.1 sec1 family domain-containing MIP3 [Chlorella sorokiniana]